MDVMGRFIVWLKVLLMEPRWAAALNTLEVIFTWVSPLRALDDLAIAKTGVCFILFIN